MFEKKERRKKGGGGRYGYEEGCQRCWCSSTHMAQPPRSKCIPMTPPSLAPCCASRASGWLMPYI
jgi:hypothetical protein